METPAFCLMFLCPHPISSKDRLDQQLVFGCRCWSDSCLLGCMRAEEVEATGCGLCFSTAFQSNSSSRSKLAVPVFCIWFRQEKSQQYSRFCNSQSLFSCLIWMLPFCFICLWNEVLFSWVLALWPNSVNEKD